MNISPRQYNELQHFRQNVGHIFETFQLSAWPTGTKDARDSRRRLYNALLYNKGMFYWLNTNRPPYEHLATYVRVYVRHYVMSHSPLRRSVPNRKCVLSRAALLKGACSKPKSTPTRVQQSAVYVYLLFRMLLHISSVIGFHWYL